MVPEIKWTYDENRGIYFSLLLRNGFPLNAVYDPSFGLLAICLKPDLYTALNIDPLSFLTMEDDIILQDNQPVFVTRCDRDDIETIVEGADKFVKLIQATPLLNPSSAE